MDKITNISQLKIFFIKTTNEKDHYEMFIQYMEDTEWSIKISIYCNTTYIFLFNIKNEDSFKKCIIQPYYVKEEIMNINKKDFRPKIFYGKNMEFKKMKIDNLRLFIGFENNKKGWININNNFKGFIGDIFIYNKNSKSSNYNENENILLNLGGNYSTIFSSFLKNQKDIYYFYDINSQYL